MKTMKKFSALILALALLASALPAAFAANATPNTTTLTTTVPSASYVLNIPADQEIPFGQAKTDIGNITITDSKNFAYGKNVKVTISHEPFISENVSTQISYSLSGVGADESVRQIINELTFKGQTDGTAQEKATINNGAMAPKYSTMETVQVSVHPTEWGKALAGDYKSTITFTSEVVVE